MAGFVDRVHEGDRQHPVFNSSLTWRLESPRFTITPQGITVSGTLLASFAGYSAKTTITGTIGLSSSPNEVVFTAAGVGASVSFDLPGYGQWRPSFTVPLGSALSFKVPLRPLRIDVPRPDGSLRPMPVRATSLSVTPQWGALVVSSEQTSW